MELGIRDQSIKWDLAHEIDDCRSNSVNYFLIKFDCLIRQFHFGKDGQEELDQIKKTN